MNDLTEKKLKILLVICFNIRLMCAEIIGDFHLNFLENLKLT